MEGFTVVAPTEADLLLAEANKLDVDVLCWGGTHRFDAYEYMDKFFVNPGSATGAMPTGWVGDGEEMVPSFCLMDVSSPDAIYPEARLIIFSITRFKVSLLHSTSISCGRMRMVLRVWAWKKLLLQKTLAVRNINKSTMIAITRMIKALLNFELFIHGMLIRSA